MSHSAFSGQPLGAPDPFKRVKFSHGLLLGVEEFEQEQSYVMRRLEWQQMLLHGPGTLYGLGVTLEGHKVIVQPGMAVDAFGRLIRVQPAQWADLDEWLGTPANLAMLREHALAARSGQAYSLYVVLNYAEEETDPVTLLGAPKMVEQSAITPSRVVEGFDLSLRIQRPELSQERSGRQLMELLGRIELVEQGGMDEKSMADLVRGLKGGGVVGGRRRLQVARGSLYEVLRTAWRVYVTEVCASPGQAIPQEPWADGALLLARLELQLSEEGRLARLDLDERERPYVLPTRILQELLVGAIGLGAGVGGGRHERRQRGPLPPRLGAPPGPPGEPPEAGSPGAEEPGPVQPPGGEPPLAESQEAAVAAPVQPFVNISRRWSEAAPTFDLSFHTPPLKDGFTFTVFSVRDTYGFDFIRPTRRVAVKEQEERGENVYRVVLEDEAAEADRFRFDFDLRAMQTRSGRPLIDLALSGEANWLGYDWAGKVTAFCDEVRPISVVVAAGIVRSDGRVHGQGLEAKVMGNGLYQLRFPGYQPSGVYVIRGTPQVGLSDPPHLFEALAGQDELGLMVRVRTADGQPGTVGFMVEITHLFEGSNRAR